MELSEQEKFILNGLYDGKTGEQISREFPESLDIQNNKAQEIVYYLDLLKDKKLIKIENDKYYSSGGMFSNKYKNNAKIIFWDSINITVEGREYIEEFRMTNLQKVKRFFKKRISNFLKAFEEGIINYLITFILGTVTGIGIREIFSVIKRILKFFISNS